MKRRHTSAHKLTAVDLQILLSLASGPLHGYGIKLDVAERTEGEMQLGSGTLYEAIQRLEQRSSDFRVRGQPIRYLDMPGDGLYRTVCWVAPKRMGSSLTFQETSVFRRCLRRADRFTRA